jgi:hypothetical protein
MKNAPLRLALPFAALLLLGACGGDEPADPPADAEDAAANATAGDDSDAVADTPAADPATPALAADSLDPVVRGIRRENEMLASVAERMAAAEDDAAKLALMTEVQPATLEAEGAAAAGVETAVYRALKDQLFTVVGQAEMRTMLEQQFASVDTTGLSDADAEAARKNAEDMRAQLGDPYAALDPAAADAIRARLQELTELRATHIGLLFKAAGG